MQTHLQIYAAAGLIVCATACATKTTVIDSRADVVRLGKGVRGQIYVWQDGAWVKHGKTTLPEGWFAGPPPPAN